MMTLHAACTWIIASRKNPGIAPERQSPETRWAYISARGAGTLTTCRRNAVKKFRAKHGRSPSPQEREDALLARAGFAEKEPS